MKLNKTLFLTAATIGLGTTAQAESGDSLNVAIAKLLSDGCGAGAAIGSTNYLLDSGDFSATRTYSNLETPTLGDLRFFRTDDSFSENPDYTWEQIDDPDATTAGFVRNIESETYRDLAFSIEQIISEDDAGNITDIAYQLSLDIPVVSTNSPPAAEDFTGRSTEDLEDDGIEDFPEGFDPQNFENSLFTDGTQTFTGAQINDPDTPGAPDLNANALQITTDITQVMDITDTYIPEAGLLGAQLQTICTYAEVLENQAVTTSYSDVFEFNVTPGVRDGSSIAFGGGNSGFSGSSASATGLAAIQAQETVSRRRGGFLATIKRLLAKAEREEEEERRQALRPYQVASLSGTGSPYIETDTSSSSLFFDASIGMINLERDPSDLEGGYSADTMFANLGAGFSFDGPFAGNDLAMIGVTGSYENTESDSADATGTGMTAFETEATTIGGFIAWSSEVVGDASHSRSFNATLAAAHGNGDQTYVRQFDFGDTSNLFDGDLDQNFTSVSFQAGMSQRFGNFTFAPRLAVNHVQFETDAYSEDFASGGDGVSGLAFELDYEGVDDEWTEFKVGAVTAIDGDLGTNSTWELALAADAVFVDDAETPDRTAFFAQDLRTGSARTPIIYSVSDLDDQYFDLSASVTMSFNDRVQPYARVFTRQGYEFVEANGAALGIRLVY